VFIYLLKVLVLSEINIILFEIISMELTLNKIEDPYTMELVDEKGKKCIMDASASMGANDRGMTPMQLLAGALVGCMSIDVLMILRKQKEEPAHYKVKIDAYKNPDAVPSPFEKIHLIFEINSAVSIKKIDRAIKLSLDKYCSVRASLSENIKITYDIVTVNI